MFAFDVFVEVAQLCRAMRTVLAIVRLFARVGSLMSLEVVAVSEHLAAVSAYSDGGQIFPSLIQQIQFRGETS